MKDLRTIFQDGIAFTDFSKQANVYITDTFQIQYTALDSDEIFLGLYKPFRQLYFELSQINVAPSDLTVRYFNGSSYVTLDLVDNTNDLSRSGFWTWELPEDWSESSVNSETKYWISISSSSDFDLEFSGINILFADDIDLQRENRTINNLLAKGDSSFVAYHEAARDEIIQSLRNGGYTTRKDGAQVSHDLTKWDILIPDQIRNAAKYLALSKIMFDVSSNVDDKWYQRFKDYRDMYNEAFKLYLLAIDSNDDGTEDNYEANNFRTVSLVKV